VRWRRRAPRLAAGAALVLAVVACSARRPAVDPGAVLFDGSIEQLAPLHAGDWFLYRVSGGAGAERLERSELTATGRPRELLLTVTSGGMVRSRVHLRLDADAVRVVSEMNLGGNIGVIYAMPMPLMIVPVYEAASFHSAVDVVRPSDGAVLDHGDIEIRVASARDPATGDIVSRVEQQLVLTGGVLPATRAFWVRPGVGNIASQGTGGERSELVCARVGGTSFGTCPSQ